jgi:hypothetical protein
VYHRYLGVSESGFLQATGHGKIHLRQGVLLVVLAPSASIRVSHPKECHETAPPTPPPREPSESLATTELTGPWFYEQLFSSGPVTTTQAATSPRCKVPCLPDFVVRSGGWQQKSLASPQVSPLVGASRLRAAAKVLMRSICSIPFRENSFVAVHEWKSQSPTVCITVIPVLLAVSVVACGFHVAVDDRPRPVTCSHHVIWTPSAAVDPGLNAAFPSYGGASALLFCFSF